MAWLFWHDAKWTNEQPLLLGPQDHAFWMSSIVFDGARSIGGVAPDLDLHCQRVVTSAERMLLAPKLAPVEVERLCIEAIRRFPSNAVLYIRPMFYATAGMLMPDADSTQFVLAVHDLPLPDPTGFSVCLTGFQRPFPAMAPVDAKASCNYPNTQRALKVAAARGFDNAVILDPDGLVAEFATANLMIGRKGRVETPTPNGTFLNGITRQRVIGLLRADGIEVAETRLTTEDVLSAEEIFSTGNYGKVMPVNRVENREMAPGPLGRRARELYYTWAQASERRLLWPTKTMTTRRLGATP